jgi:hypothetical protein
MSHESVTISCQHTLTLTMRFLVIIALASVCLSLPAADGFSFNWTDEPDNMKLVGAEGMESEYTICRLSVRGGLYMPSEPVRLSLVRPAQPVRNAENGSLVAVPITTAQFDPTEDGFVHPKAPRRIALTAGVEPTLTPLASFAIAGDEWSGTLLLPEAFGLYAVLLQRTDGTRSVLGSIARVPKPQPRLGRWRQVMGELEMPGGYVWHRAHDEDAILAAMARAGVGLVRKEIQSGLAKPEDGETDAGQGLDPLFAAARAHGVQVMITAGCHQDIPLRNAGVNISHQLPPSFDPMLTKWFAAFARRHWSGGESGLWAMEHFNEPWEPVGISGWNSDSQRYRQLLKCLHDGAKSVDKRILIAGTSSVMNTEDKLLSGDSREHMQMLDLMSDHYVSLFAAYGPRVAEKHGIVSGETETWGAHSQVLVAQFMTQFLSNGQKWINPAKVMWKAAPGLDRDLVPRGKDKEYRVGVVTPHPATVGLAVWNAIIQDREFKRMAFTTHLPYLFQFGEDGDARLVLYGRPTSTGSGRMEDYPWWQVLQGPTGAMTIPDPQRVLEARDLNGNPLPRAADGSLRVSMDTSAYYLWSAKGAGTVIEAVRAGIIEGIRAVHIAPNGIRPDRASGQILPVTLHNVLNRPVRGVLRVASINPQVALTYSADVALTTGSDQTVEVPVPQAVGGLPVRIEFAGDGFAATTATEVIQTTVISKGAPADAASWASRPGATVIRAQGKVVGSEMEAVWLPFVQKKEVTVPTRRGEVKLAWDDRALHIHATVDAASVRPRPRLATRQDDAYFYNDAWIENRFGALRPHIRFLKWNNSKERKIWGGENRPWWVDPTAEPGWKEYQDFLASRPDMKRLIDSGEAKKWAEAGDKGSVAHLNYVYLPDTPMIDHLPFQGDAFQFAIDVDQPDEVMRKTHDLTYPADAMPKYWTAVPDSDYEFSLYLCDDGKPELWCLMAPGVPRGHYFPRQERGRINQHAVIADTAVVHIDGRTIYRASIPWSVLGGKPWPVESNVGFTFTFNAADGGHVGFGGGSGATKMNSLTMHPYWQPKPSNTIRWTVLP